MKIKNRRGQVLLIAVMLLATVITVVMTIAFNTTTETQVTRLEVDSQKALAAAEAGVEAVIKQSVGSGVIQKIEEIGQFSAQGITGSAKVEGISKPYFVSPLIQKDEQYTFYLSEYIAPVFSPVYVTHSFQNPWSGSFDIHMISEAGCPSLEVTIVKQDYSLERYAYNTCSSPGLINNATAASQPSQPTVIDGVSFTHKTPSKIVVENGLVAFVKVLNGRTKLGFQSADSAVSFPIQGKTVESEARTASGVVKKVQLFQSYPQIPSNFFMTSF